jgi:dinuclear metal center YbgI/SA1388 family protein
MPTIHEIGEFLEVFAPRRLAESWDNVGLLVGDPARPVQRALTCLTVTPAVVEEAVGEQVDLIVSHHPLPFQPLKRLTTETLPGRLLLRLIRAEVAVYSPHTAFDSAAAGINHRLADMLGLIDVLPLVPLPNDPQGLGSGRWGRLPAALTLGELATRLKQCLRVTHLQVVGGEEQRMETVAVACGSAGQFLTAAQAAGCEALVVGETSFHTCVEAEANRVALLMPGHYASERFGVERLADVLADQFRQIDVWPSRQETDPVQWR